MQHITIQYNHIKIFQGFKYIGTNTVFSNIYHNANVSLGISSFAFEITLWKSFGSMFNLYIRASGISILQKIWYSKVQYIFQRLKHLALFITYCKFRKEIKFKLIQKTMNSASGCISITFTGTKQIIYCDRCVQYNTEVNIHFKNTIHLFLY